jgi:hypothetical protein
MTRVAGTRAGLVALAAVAIATITRPMPAEGAEDPVEGLPFAVATEQLFDEAHNDGLHGAQGTWELLRGTLGAGGLRLTFRIEPPVHGLPVASGPAVLFGGLQLYGDAGGDVATGVNVDALTAVTLRPCVDAACRYAAEITLPLDDLGPAITRLEADGRLVWVSADFTLVRTFAQGTWVQVLPFMTGDAGPAEASGRLGAVEPAAGTLFSYGLFPADQATPIPADPAGFRAGLDYGGVVEQRRQEAGDATPPLPAVPAVLHVAVNPACDASQVLTVHDTTGDRIATLPLLGRPAIEQPVALPVGVPWWLTLHDGGGIDFDQGRHGWGVRVGPIPATAVPLTIQAKFDCSLPRGTFQVTSAPIGPGDGVVGPAAGDPPSILTLGPLLAVLVSVALAIARVAVRRRPGL